MSPPSSSAASAPNPFALAADRLDPTPSPYATDPVAWSHDRLRQHLWSKQAEISASVVANRYTAVRSCHDVGKSFTAGVLAAWWLDSHPRGEAFVVSTAPTFPQVRAILWKEIRRAHRRGGLAGRVNQTEWWIDGEIVGYGRKPANADPGAFQGIHARWVLVIIDEACGVTSTPLWDAVDSLVANEDSRVLAIGNPDDPSTHFAKVCKPGSGWNVIGISAFESPNLTGEKVPAELSPLLVSRTWVDEREKRWGTTSPRYVSKVLGEFPELSDDTLIWPKWVEAAMGRDLVPEPDDPEALGVDIARYGDDESVVYHRRGPVVRLVHHSSKASTMATAGHVKLAIEACHHAVAHIDEAGIGGGVIDRLAELLQPVRGLNGGSRANDPEHFDRARSEWYWGLRLRFEAGDIDIDSADEDLAAQLVALRYRIDSRGRICVETKDEMRRRRVGSPDRADALSYAFVAPAASVMPGSHVGSTITGDLFKVEF